MPPAVGGARTTSTYQPIASLVYRSSSLGGYPAQGLQSELANLNSNAGLWDQGWLAHNRCSILLGKVFTAPPHLF